LEVEVSDASGRGFQCDVQCSRQQVKQRSISYR
jgi:hypothetical protein